MDKCVTTDEKLDYVMRQNDEIVEWIKTFIEQLPQHKPLVN